jgi:muramidase (phage lysozyme)
MLSPTLKNFLSLVAFSEGTSTEAATKNDGYDVIVTGEDELGGLVHEEVFTDYSDHPFANGRPPMIIREGPPALKSTASGRYQVILPTWLAYKKRLALADFSPASQDAVGAQLVADHHAVVPLMDGDVKTAITLCNGIWASMPGNVYGQGGKSMAALLRQWGLINSQGA